ncbi:zona pellucida protein C [Thunnus maccoyii]|uniref:zona pellucida protein C n=1 Tax=Thunnus maccoyii TaxID=8240 RepID=UPI001C4A9BF4|nr:zona pellucida protein C [Thunnus maccoyii]
MGTAEIFLCIFVGNFIPVHSVIQQDAAFSQAFPGFFKNIMRFPFERNFDFPPFDTIFSSWRSRTPDFHILSELPPIMKVPRVQVSCDESQLTLLVDKRLNGVTLNGDEIQLGDGCYSNGELPNQFVFTYSFDQCGTTHSMQNGLEIFSNFLHLNLQNPPSTWWPSPLTVDVSCMTKRSNPNFFVSAALPDKGRSFNIKAMNPSWTSTAESNIYKRGQVVNLQVSAETRADQQLFIQSCFVSASPEPQTRPRHAVILNKGCTAPLGSPHAVIQFVASNRADMVNVALNTSYLISEMYIHCSVLISGQGVTPGSKSCNYNMIQSRWEELSGNIEVCSCCSSKCKGLSVKHLPDDAKAIISTGPLIIVDKEDETRPAPSVSEPQETSNIPVTDTMQSDAAVPEDTFVSGTSVSRSKFSESQWSSPPQGVVVVSQDPVARLTVWLPGQVQDIEHSDDIGSQVVDNSTAQLQPSNMISNDLPELQPSTTDQESVLNTPTKKIRESLTKQGNEIPVWDLNLMTLVDGWVIPSEAPPAEMNINDLNQNDFNQMRDESAQRWTDAAIMHQDKTNDAQPIIRSKLQFSKSTDGTQTLSYEEEAVKQHEGKGAIRRFGVDGIKRKQEPRQRGLLSTFLDLLRRLDKAE